jgi:hypothetical protein
MKTESTRPVSRPRGGLSRRDAGQSEVIFSVAVY